MAYNGIADFRSDTVTRPTPEMMKAMATAELGDDVLGDDPTVQKLEEITSEMLGMEASLFVPSGTMGNTIAIKLSAAEGKVVLMEEHCHIYKFEAGNVSRIAGAVPRPLPSHRGEIPIDTLEANIFNILPDHIPETKVITLENTHNVWGGAVLSLDYLARVRKLADRHRLFVHLDGARMFHASTALDVDIREITKHVDSVMFCLSKGLSAPIGSMLSGSREFIQEARLVRKYLGGGMRQVGIIAAAGIIAVEQMTKRLNEDHIRARRLAERLIEIDGISVDPQSVETNFVMLDLLNSTSDPFLKQLASHNVLALPFSDTRIRFCLHKDIDDRDIDRAFSAIRSIV